jgi:hypothetical protein
MTPSSSEAHGTGSQSHQEILDVFLSASGMQLNLDKSHIFFFNSPNILQLKISRILGFQRSSLPSRYLGAPLLEKDIRNLGWQELLTKLENRLNCWTHRFLTLPGRILLIKSVLMAMSVYLFSVLAAPEYIYQKIHSLQRNFLWGGPKRERKWALVAWEKMCKPKAQGGLGLKDPQRLSQALATNFFWRWIKNPTTLWARIWQGKYAKDISPQDWIQLEGERPGSIIWNYAWKNRELVQKKSFWELHDGQSTLFWEDAWEKRSTLSSNE